MPASDPELSSEDDTSDSDYEYRSLSSNSEEHVQTRSVGYIDNAVARNAIQSKAIDNVVARNVIQGKADEKAVAITSCFNLLGLSRELRDQIYRCTIPVHISASDYYTNIHKKGARLPRLYRINR